MVLKSFALVTDGLPSNDSHDIEVDVSHDLAALQRDVASYYNIIVPEGVTFHEGTGTLRDIDEIASAKSTIGIMVDGRPIRNPPGPKGLPIVGSFYEVFPDHLGNHERLFQQYGPLIEYETMGKKNFQTNDPVLAGICLSESAFFSKIMVPDHPLGPIKDNRALFLSDTSSPSWALAHKFVAPALTPKAIRHYTPLMAETAREAFKIFDKFDEKEEAWNVYQYMVKMGSQVIGKVALGQNFNHFESEDTPLSDVPMSFIKLLELNKSVTRRGEWYRQLPFGDPLRLRRIVEHVETLIDDACETAPKGANGVDLPLQSAALSATCLVDYLMRATDEKGEKLPHELLISNIQVVVGAGFSTTSSLLSWLIYSLCVYEGCQERLLQELVDHGINSETEWTPDLADELVYQDKFIKETQRRHNPSFQPGRTAKVDCILPGGYFLRAGSVVITALHALHTNTKIWDNADKFDPDRWDTPKVKNRPKNSYIPFATGPRSCIGFNFALGEVRVLLPELVYRYEFTKVGDHTIQYDPEFSLIRPNNLYVRAKRRTEWPSPTLKDDDAA